jgi:hypothetical protein
VTIRVQLLPTTCRRTDSNSAAAIAGAPRLIGAPGRTDMQKTEREF